MNRLAMSLYTARIDSLSHRGEGVGRVLSGPDAGLVVFIPGTAPGDLVQYSVVERKKNYIRGRIRRLLEEGPGRVKEACPVASECGGCSWQHLSYDMQLEWKQRIVQESLARIAHVEGCEVRECIPSPDVVGYRNKVEVPLALSRGRVVAGFYKPLTHEVVPSESCLLEHPLAREVISRMLEEVAARGYTVYDERSGRGQVRHAMARVAPGTGERMAVLVTNCRGLPGEKEFAKAMSSLSGLSSVLLNINTERTNVVLGQRDRLLLGRGYIEDLFGDDEIGRLRFRISPHSFYQVNSRQAGRLYGLVLDAASLNPGDVVLDVYSGIGSITLFAAKRAALAVGIEEVGEAVRDAETNAKLNGIDNVRFRAGRAERVLPAVISELGGPDVVILDPPRAGADRAALGAISRARPRCLVYVSCNPATLARDVSLLTEEGWRVAFVQPLDMFPQTPHVEVIVLLKR